MPVFFGPGDNIKPAGEVNSFLIQLRDDQGQNLTSYFTEGLEVRW